MTMTTTPGRIEPGSIRARPAGFLRDVSSIAGRATRAIPRDSEAVMPSVFIAVFFYLVNVGQLQDIAEANVPGLDFKAFQIPTAILLGANGASRVYAFVLDIQNGYFDRILMTPIHRLAILFGHLCADAVMAVVVTLPVLVIGLALGAEFKTGPLGVLLFIIFAVGWNVSFAGFGYAIALRTGNPAAVNSSFLLFFPFLFLSTAFVTREQLTGWLGAVAAWNPVTYLLEGMRSILMRGWEWGDIGQAVLVIVAVGVVSMCLCLAALRSRLRQM